MEDFLLLSLNKQYVTRSKEEWEQGQFRGGLERDGSIVSIVSIVGCDSID